MQAPKAGEVWVHIDRLGNADKRIWAVQWIGPKGGANYKTFLTVEIHGRCYTRFHGLAAKQPRAIIVVDQGTVEQPGDGRAIVSNAGM